MNFGSWKDQHFRIVHSVIFGIERTSLFLSHTRGTLTSGQSLKSPVLLRKNRKLPPPAVKTVRDLLYWQYGKIISNSAGVGKNNYGFIMDRYLKLTSGEIQWSTSIREYVKEHEEAGTCVYCGSDGDLTLDHMLPRVRGGPDVPENAVWVCASCNSSKGSKRLYEWYGLEGRNDLPRIAEGKYLKLLYSIHETRGTLSAVPTDLCRACDLGAKCPVEGKLSVFCLEGCFTKS
jgi:hypothetical protein